MKLSRSDIPLLRWSLLAICASLALSSAILFISNEYSEKAKSDLRKARNSGIDARSHLAAAREDRENMSIYADEYGTLIKHKIIGDDQRLDWMEGLEQLRQRDLVTDFRYRIAPQKDYAPRPPFDTGKFDIHYSEMKLQFDLLHEVQLVDFFSALRNKMDGWYQLEGCALLRSASEEETAVGPAAAQLKAECSGGWITLKNRNAQP